MFDNSDNEPIVEYGLIGYPLGHSFSRSFFTEKFERENINARYTNFQIEKISELKNILQRNKTLHGFNVTIPHKQSVIPFLDRVVEEAREIGAVNVVKVEKDGKLSGYNTDVYGFVESIKPLLIPEIHKKALVLGTGGASKAVCYGLNKLGLETARVSRKPTADDYSYAELSPVLMREYKVIVNTTPVGMYPNTETAPDIPYDSLTAEHVCFDLVYNPTVTRFMEESRLRGATVANGLRMLHLQAKRSWEIWISNDEKFSRGAEECANMEAPIL